MNSRERVIAALNHKWGLLNTFGALILPSPTGVFGIFLIR